MRLPIEMQQLGPDFRSGVIVEWLKAVGDRVVEGEPLILVETEKVDVDVAALETGILAEIVAEQGAEVALGEIIGYLEVED